jgi:hypothetical protein
MEHPPYHDLLAFSARMAPLDLSSGGTSQGHRAPATCRVRADDAVTQPVSGDPAPIAAVVDGIQTSRVIQWLDHMPVTLAYVAAAALPLIEALPAAAIERLMVIVTDRTAERLGERLGDLPVVTVPNDLPWAVEASVTATVSAWREHAEVALVRRLLADPAYADTMIVVDGSVRAHLVDDRLVGIVKTCHTRYLADETALLSLDTGHCHGPIDLPWAASAYLRLHPASDDKWDHGLIRLEAHQRQQLRPLAAWCLTQRQSRWSGDERWDRHLQAVAECERLLRARLPVLLTATT